jgi:Secretion system C-terminal sorting domain
MKTRNLGLLFTGIMLCFTSSAQTATDVSITDCHGVTHDLFNDLDAGKIIVIGWTMPCSACAVPLLDVHNAVLNYAISDPGVVEYWMNDDYANTACNTVEGWGTSNGISNAFFFSTATLNMLDYGSTGMPKVIVVGCANHHVYYNVNDFPTGAGVTVAVDQALADIAGSCLLEVDELVDSKFNLTCFPNPANDELNMTYVIESKETISLQLIDLNGSILKEAVVKNSNNDLNSYTMDVSDLSEGMYVLKMIGGENSEVIRIQVAH